MSEIKLIIHASDIHMRNVRRHEEYKEILDKFLIDCQNIITDKGYTPDEVRICLLGDIVHQKIQMSNELSIFLGNFLKELDNIATTYVIAGNHDYIVSNKERVDSITPTFQLIDFERTTYLDKESDYKSAIINDGNVMWCLYSIFDDYLKPDINAIKKEGDKRKFIGLFHGPIIGSSTDVGYVFDKGISPDIFEGCDFVMCGDIHKRQILKVNGVDIIYSGSLIQQDYGENVNGHGYVIYDLENDTREFIDIPSDYGFYKFKIKDIDDLTNNKEKLINCNSTIPIL